MTPHPIMDTEDRPAEENRHRDTRTRFERAVGIAQQVVGRPEAFTVAVVVIVVWAFSFPLFPDAKEWQVVIHTVASLVSLLLLFLLENAGRRGEEAAQEKLNVMSEALVALLEDRAAAHGPGPDHDRLAEHAEDLRSAVGLEDRH